MKKESKETVYEMGYEKGKSLAIVWKEMGYVLNDDTIITPDGEVLEVGEAISEWWEGFTQYSEYCNFILPDLRMLAGFKDPLNVGTYTEGGEDEHFNLDELSDCYDRGIYDGFEYVFKDTIYNKNKVTSK